MRERIDIVARARRCLRWIAFISICGEHRYGTLVCISGWTTEKMAGVRRSYAMIYLRAEGIGVG